MKANVVQDTTDDQQMKTEHAGEDAITDEVAAKAYMEQFGIETFLRADNAVRANKASKYGPSTASMSTVLTCSEPLQIPSKQHSLS